LNLRWRKALAPKSRQKTVMDAMVPPSPVQRVFVVEDDQAVRDALAVLLEANGYDVQTFGSGGAFLRQSNPGTGDVLVLDISMPGLDGVEVSQNLRDRGVTCPIVVISGLRDNAFQRAVEKIRPMAAFRKPLSGHDLLAACGGALA